MIPIEFARRVGRVRQEDVRSTGEDFSARLVAEAVRRLTEELEPTRITALPEK